MVLRLAILTCIALSLVACNDAPTNVDGTLIPGTDSLYSISSDTIGLLSGIRQKTVQKPLLNGTYVLVGQTTDSRASAFVQITNYPAFPNADDFTIVSSDLEMLPMPYQYGDTTNKLFSIRGYELKRRFPLDATWDSVYDAGGLTTYYSAGDPTIMEFSKELQSTDTILYVPIDKAVMKRWVSTFGDTAARTNLFGMAIEPNGMGEIRQLRNLTGATQLMRYRVVYKHKDSATDDTTFITNALINYTNTPKPVTGELVVQGTGIHFLELDVDLAKIPKNALIISAKLELAIDVAASKAGTAGLDESLGLYYTLADSSISYYATLRNEDTYTFNNVAYGLQLAIKAGLTTRTFSLRPTGSTELWQMNRIVIKSPPKLTLVYTIPRLLQ